MDIVIPPFSLKAWKQKEGLLCLLQLLLCVLTSYLLVTTLSHWLLSIGSCIFFCLTEELSVVCGAVPPVLCDCDFPTSIVLGMFSHHGVKLSCVMCSLGYAVLAHIKDMFIRQGQNKKNLKNRSFFVGPEEP